MPVPEPCEPNEQNSLLALSHSKLSPTALTYKVPVLLMILRRKESIVESIPQLSQTSCHKLAEALLIADFIQQSLRGDENPSLAEQCQAEYLTCDKSVTFIHCGSRAAADHIASRDSGATRLGPQDQCL